MRQAGEDRGQLRELAGWLIIVPVVLLILFGCGQLALLRQPPVTYADTRSQLSADYHPWTPVVFAAVSTEIVSEILQDYGQDPTDPQIIVTASPFWPTQVGGTPIAFIPTKTATPTVLPTATHTPVPSDTSAPTPTPATPTATQTVTRLPTRLPTLAPPTPTETATSVPPPMPTNVPPPAPTDTSAPPLPTPTVDTPIPPLPTDTQTPTLPATLTDTPGFVPSFTPTPTPTLTLIPTDTPIPCSGNNPSGEPDLGGPDGNYIRIGCGSELIIDLGANPLILPHPSYDLVFYEREDPDTPGTIALDWIVIEVGPSSAGPWMTIFTWGDNAVDSNTNIGAAGYGAAGELDNHPIPMTDPPLYGSPPFVTGIAIDVDAVVPPGVYQWVRIRSPLGGDNDPAEVDALQVIVP
jgi:hypothetical protein